MHKEAYEPQWCKYTYFHTLKSSTFLDRKYKYDIAAWLKQPFKQKTLTPSCTKWYGINLCFLADDLNLPQEAQLSQRGHVMYHIVENFAKGNCYVEFMAVDISNFSQYCHSQVLWNYTVEYGVCKFLSVFHCNYVATSYRFWNVQHRIMVCPWNLS